MERTVDWVGGKIRLIDQTLLPEKFEFIFVDDYRDIARCIKEMKVRGAPAIGAAAALGMVLAAQKIDKNNTNDFLSELLKASEIIRQTRPTAINLFWGIDRILGTVKNNLDKSVNEIKSILEAEGLKILDEDERANRMIGDFGAELLPVEGSVLTHCNAGALATVGFGTALGVVRAAIMKGKKIHVYADETRPRLQGMKLTAWELMRDSIPVTVITDNMAGWLMLQSKISCVIVGADRIAANGDTANKIGTYSLSVLAKTHQVPFYVAAPLSTVDIAIATGAEIPIEERPSIEVTSIDGLQIAPNGVQVINPSFDVTPAGNITAIITEHGILRPPYSDVLNRAIFKTQRLD